MKRKRQRAAVRRSRVTPTLGGLGNSGLKHNGRPGARLTKKAVQWEGSHAGAWPCSFFTGKKWLRF